MVEHALTSLQMMVHRSGSVDGEGDGSGLHGRPAPAARGAGGWSARARPGAADDPRFTVAHIFFDSDRGRRRPRCRASRRSSPSTASRCSGAARGRSTAAPSGRAPPRPRRSSGSSPAWPREAGTGAPPPATGRWCRWSASSTATSPRSRPTTPSTRSRASRRSSRASTRRWRSPTSPSSRIIAHNRYSTNTLPHVQPRAAVLDPGPQRRDQHDRPAPRAERAARPAHHARRLGLARTSTACSRA